MSYKIGDRVAYVHSEGGELYVGRYRDKQGNPGVAEIKYFSGSLPIIHAVMVSGIKKGTHVAFLESEIAPSMKIIAVKRGLPGFAVKLFGKILGESGNVYRFGYIRTLAFRGWACNCEDFVQRRALKNQNCKHLHFVRAELGRYGAEAK
jgi:hypothetical protein